jgi:hypothetical protein
MKIKVNMQSSKACGRVLTPFVPSEKIMLFYLLIVMD